LDWAYSADFARRFKLDESKIEKMSPGLHAIEFRLEKSANSNISFECLIDLYISNDLKFQFPESNPSGNLSVVNHLNNTFPYTNRTKNDKHFYIDDTLYNISVSNRYTIKPFTNNFGHTPLFINTFRKNAFDNIHYLSIKTPNCAELLPPKYGMDILLRKKNNKKYQAEFTPNDVLRVPVPNGLHVRICPYIEKNAYLSLDKQLRNSPEMKDILRRSKEKINNYPFCCKK
jgi:hypothetical protein